jgi:glycine/D-amino acid oxidase-like deaminating enzyme
MSGALEFDVLVAGGGINGMSAALELAGEGLGIIVVDDGRHCGSIANAGSLHVQMQSRLIRLFPELAAGVERSLALYRAAVRCWHELAGALGTDIGLKTTGGLMVAENAEQLAFLASKAERERALGLEVHILDRSELARVAPYLGEVALGAELCVDEGKIDPLKANAAIRAAFLARGGVRIDEARVVAITVEGGRHRIAVADRDGERTYRAGRVLLAAGAGTGALAALLGATVPTKAEPLHMNVTEATEPLITHLVQHAERMITLKQLGAGQVVIGGGWPARLTGPDLFPSVDPASMVANLSLAQTIVPRLGALRVIRTWAGINTTSDGQCILGALPGAPGVHVAVGGDAGYTLGPLVGRIAAALIRGRDPGHDVARFTPARFSRG